MMKSAPKESPTSSGTLSDLQRQLLDELLQEEDVGGPERIPQRTGSGPARLSFTQQRVWFLDRLEGGSSAYKVQAVVPLIGSLEIDTLQRCLDEIVRRHESLRTTFRVIDGEPMQIVGAPYAVDLPLEDLSHLNHELSQAATDRWVKSEAERAFDLEKGPPLRCLLLRLTSELHLLMISMHHIISDGWSERVFINELGALYAAFSAGQPSPLKPLPIQFADYADWQRGTLQQEALERQLAYWREQLKGPLPVMELPLDYARPAVQSGRGAKITRMLPRELGDALNVLSRERRASLFMTMLAAFKLLLARQMGQTDTIVGTPVSGRNHVQTESLIGFFINTVVLRTEVAGQLTFAQLVDRVRQVTLDAFAQQDVPFEKLVEELHPVRDTSRMPIVQLFFNMVNLPPAAAAAMPTGLRFGEFVPIDIDSKFDLTIYVVEKQQGIEVTALYNAALFSAERMDALLAAYEHILRQAAERSDAPLDAISLVTPESQSRIPDPRQALVPQWAGSVVERFGKHACSGPDRIAISGKQENWTYGELHSWSSKLAGYLRSQGVCAGQVVAIYAHRTPELVWALLATMKAGAAFVVLDAEYPAAYLAECIRAAEPRGCIALGGSALPDEIKAALHAVGCAEPISLPANKPRGSSFFLADCSADEPWVAISADAPAYIAFTSGSTGKPKGILGSHRPLSHFVEWHAGTFGLNASDHFSMLSGLAHDPLLRDVLTPLWLGAQLHVPSSEDRLQPERLRAWMRKEGVTVCHLTPSLCEVLTTGADECAVPALRHAFFGGEALCGQHVLKLRQLAPSVECVNFYGATETPQAMGHFIVRGDVSADCQIPVGRGIDGAQLLVLGGAGNLAGIGELGEIYIRTPYLSQGYVDSDLTSGCFLSNPFTGDPADRLYRTGDLGRYLADGSVRFHGRRDQQLKIRGFRVEVSQIEAAIGEHASVESCAVLVDRQTAAELLLAYVVPRDTQAFAPDDLRLFVKSKLPPYMIPARFIALDSLPLTPNGKVCYESLRRAGSASLPAVHYEPPRDSLELSLAAIWKRVLGVSELGIRDDFFDRGGHSLLAIRLFSEIEKELGKVLPVATLFQAPTIEQLAATLREEGVSCTSSLVPIKPDGSAPPFFCVHSFGTNLVSYGALARRLPKDQPFYGLQPVGLDGTSVPHSRIEQMASHYLSEIRKIQPQGPYYIGGVCLGGIIAFEIAQQLVRAGESVGELILIDAGMPGTPKYLPKRTLHYGFLEQMDWYLGEMALLPVSGKVKFVGTRLTNICRRSARALREGLGLVFPLIAPHEASIVQHIKKVRAQNGVAILHYTPEMYPGRITLLWSTETPNRCYRDRRLAWSEVAGGGLLVHTIPGNHMTMVEPPHVEVLASTLSRCLEKAQAAQQKSR